MSSEGKDGGERGFLERSLRGLYRRFLPPAAKNGLRVRLLFDEREKPVTVLRRFDERRVLALAPHPDDETIGCGGTLRHHVSAGARTTVAVLSDGALGGDPSVRRAEAARACEELGVADLRLLGGPDGALATHAGTRSDLAALVGELRPEVVYLPSLLDPHADHWAANLAFAACADAVAPGCRVRQYEVWSPLVANAVVDVSATWSAKDAALGCYASQHAPVDVRRLAAGLASYRACLSVVGATHAEAFFDSDLATYLAFAARARGGR